MIFDDFDKFSFGHTLQMVGAVYGGKDGNFFLPFPGEDAHRPIERVVMTKEDWDVLIKQTDLLETEIIQNSPDGQLTKILIRKSARQISQDISWRCFRRDGFACCYCGATDRPLTVDHLVTWEEGGPSTEANMVAADSVCNRTRGRLGYKEWLESADYAKLSKGITTDRKAKNAALVATLAYIPRLQHKKSR